ncbi:MAG: efflux RND transporter permease subunit [Bacteroidales bacterium]|nr:efflux RND transporter permease subunit [Bacteroidales bacterium]
MKMIINRKVLISMLFAGLTLLGYISYKQLPVELYPNPELPYLIVQVYAGQEVDPKYMENAAVIPLEGAVNMVGGVDAISSYIRSRNAQIVVSFKKNENMNLAYLKLQEKINSMKENLPEQFRVQVARINLEKMNSRFMELQVTGEGDVDRVRNLVDRRIKPELENIDGIAGVQVFGGRRKSMEIRLDMNACKAYGVSPSHILTLLRQNTANRAYAGNLYEDGKRYFVQVEADYSNIHDMENLVVARGPVLLKDVAEVYFGFMEEKSYSRVNGENAVSLFLLNDAQSNLIDLSQKTQETIRQLNRKYGHLGLNIVIRSNVAEVMEKNIDQIMHLALIGGILAVFVLWIFLKDLRLVSFVALAIPISVFTAFNLFYGFNITLNSFTLIGMALAIGMLLDNSVVVLENIYRLSSYGAPPDRAVLQGTREVWRSVFAATLTTVMVFVPFLFSANWMIRLLGGEISISIISTLLVSLLVALMFIPMTTHSLLKRRRSKPVFYEKVTTNKRIIQFYVLLLKSGLRRPAATMIWALALFFISVFIMLAVHVPALKNTEKDAFAIHVNTYGGATLQTTDNIVRQIEEKLDDLTEKEDVISNVREQDAIVTVKLKKNYEKIAGHTIEVIMDDIRSRMRNIKGANLNVTTTNTGGNAGGMNNKVLGNFQRLLGMGSQNEQIYIKGRDFTVMRRVASDLRYFMGNLENIRWVNVSNLPNRSPEVDLIFNPYLMNEFGITLASVSSELASFSNEFSSGFTFRQGTDEYEIVLKEKEVSAEEKKSKNMDDLIRMPVRGKAGTVYPLGSFAQVVYARGVSGITRENQGKRITLNYAFNREVYRSKGLLETSRKEVNDILTAYNMPAGVAVEMVNQENQFKDFYFLIGAAILLIFMILASVFESLSVPFVLLFSIPLAATGSFLALLITHNSLFNANTLTGFIILIGIVVNNGILLIDYTNILRKRGYRKTRALMTAGMSRVRPILITAITTIVAMFPLAMGKAEYVSAIGAPFAITVIGGLSFSTLLTLIIVPVFYSGLENALLWFRGLDLKVKILQLGLIIAGAWLVFVNVDAFLWRMLLFILLVLVVPGTTWFMLSSLRRAGMHLIPEHEPVRIRLQNLVKIYDRDSRFVREWKGGKKIRERAGLEKHYRRKEDFYDLIWEIPVYLFMVYFTFFYLQSGFWALLLAVVLYLYTLVLYRPLGKILQNKYEETERKFYRKTDHTLYKFIFWFLPLVILAVFAGQWRNPGVVVATGALWYLLLGVYAVSAKLYREKINVDRIMGRFGGMRRGFYRLVRQIPLLGKRRTPFKALRGITLDIGTGMFGLLGPNGAGKTTLMRIVCGIYDQSYGKVWINGIDTLRKREELQGYIGYLPQEFGMYENLTAWEYLDYQAILKGLKDQDVRMARLKYVLASVHMLDHKDEKIGSFSGGMKQRIGIAQILLHLPRILVVDEPTAGLDPRERIRFRNLLVELSRERVVLFSTHIIEDISSSCNQVAVIDRGELKYYGVPHEMNKLAGGLVWQADVTEAVFRKLAGKYLIVHHMQVEEKIRVRLISKEKPAAEAINVTPLLEDAYLCLLKNIRK